MIHYIINMNNIYNINNAMQSGLSCSGQCPSVCVVESFNRSLSLQLYFVLFGTLSWFFKTFPFVTSHMTFRFVSWLMCQPSVPFVPEKRALCCQKHLFLKWWLSDLDYIRRTDNSCSLRCNSHVHLPILIHVGRDHSPASSSAHRMINCIERV